jgi:hypothetical protein
MWIWLLGTGLAHAACPDVDALVDDAWAAFDDAEVERARELVGQAHSALTCTPRAMELEELLELYRLEGLVSLAQMDRRGAVYATIRAVVADPSAPPPPDYGPDLSELYALWAERMTGTTGAVRVYGTDVVYVDGRLVTSELEVLQGEHLIQVQDAAGWRGEVVEVGLSHDVETSGASRDRPATVVPVGLDEPDPAPETVATRPVKSGSGAKTRRAVMLSLSGVAIVSGSVLAGSGFMREGAFDDDPFDAPTYGGCGANAPCYAEARQGAIEAEARAINGLYGMGYGLIGVGVVLGGVELVVLPHPTAAGGTVGIRGAW